LASLFFGDGFQGFQILDFLLIAALIFGGIMLFRRMRRGATPTPVGIGAGSGKNASPFGSVAMPRDTQPSSHASGFSPSITPDENEVPVWFDPTKFADGAKAHFLRLQSAWDKADLSDIKEYTTPQLFEELKRERLALGTGPQFTEVVTLKVQFAGMRRDGNLAVVSLEFSGLIREEASGIANPFREIWHIQHAWNTSEGDWFVSGIQQVG